MNDPTMLLTKFPARQDNITRTFICNGVASSHPGDRNRTADVHRKAPPASLPQLPMPPNAIIPHNSKFVLVDESQFASLSDFEEKHQRDMSLLAEHAVQPEAVNAAGIPRVYQEHIPAPAARRAVHDFCEAEMRKISADIAELNKAWLKHSKANHYNKPHLFQRDSYLSRPKTIKLRHVHEAVESWLARKERDTMMFEDDMSKLVGKYIEAQIRRRDYDRYYVLATHYGVWTAQVYYRAPRPGKRYWQLVTDAALKFQKLWTVYWAVTRLRRFRCARAIQTIWRARYHFRKRNPLIKLRVKCGKRSVMKFFWLRWLEYNSLCRKIKDAIRFQLASWRDKCFNAWKEMFRSKKNRKEEVIKKFVLRMKNIEVTGCFLQWQTFTKRRKRGKHFLRRLLQCPHFDAWHKYTLHRKKTKRQDRAAMVMQGLVRMGLRRHKFMRMKRAAGVLDRFLVFSYAHLIVRLRRQVRINEEFEGWMPEELHRRDRAATDIERRRVMRQGQILKEKERKAVSELKRHWRTRDGKTQLLELVQDLRGQSGLSAASSSQAQQAKPATLGTQLQNLSSLLGVVRASEKELDKSKRLLLRQCKYITDVQETHEFNVKSAPYIVCPHPYCGRVFTSDDVYRAHRLHSRYHNAEVADASLEPVSPADADPADVGADNVNDVNEGDDLDNNAAVSALNEEAAEALIKEDPELQLSAESNQDPANVNNNDGIDEEAVVEHDTEKIMEEVAVDQVRDEPDAAEEVDIKDNDTKPGDDMHAASGVPGENSDVAEVPTKNSRNDKNNKMIVRLPPVRQDWLLDDPVLPFTELHIQLRHPLGIDLLRSFLIGSRGIDSAVNCLDLWAAIEDWRRKSVHSEHYRSKALNILETYLCEDCSRPLELISVSASDQSDPPTAAVKSSKAAATDRRQPIASESNNRTSTYGSNSSSSAPGHVNSLCSKYDIKTYVKSSMETIVERLTDVKEADELSGIVSHAHHKGVHSGSSDYLDSARASVNIFRRLFGLSGRFYNSWTDRRVIPADIFNELQWWVLVRLHGILVHDSNYLQSEEHRKYSEIVRNDAEERRAALLVDYKVVRNAEYLQWARAFRLRELRMLDLALECANSAMEVEVERLAMVFMRIGANEVLDVTRQTEQATHEHVAATVDEALDWACIDVMEAVYEFYTKNMLAVMWTHTELRKGMLQYSGLLKSTRSSAYMRLLTTGKDPKETSGRGAQSGVGAKDSEEWFKDFFAAALEEERDHLPIEASVAASRIQARVRGIIGRKRARKEFVATFYKRYVLFSVVFSTSWNGVELFGRYDNSSGACYYVNTSYGTTSWTKPAIHSRLFTNGKW
jgi:hypothetical protein